MRVLKSHAQVYAKQVYNIFFPLSSKCFTFFTKLVNFSVKASLFFCLSYLPNEFVTADCSYVIRQIPTDVRCIKFVYCIWIYDFHLASLHKQGIPYWGTYRYSTGFLCVGVCVCVCVLPKGFYSEKFLFRTDIFSTHKSTEAHYIEWFSSRKVIIPKLFIPKIIILNGFFRTVVNLKGCYSEILNIKTRFSE